MAESFPTIRNLPRVLRLLPASDPARCPDAPARHSCDDARFDGLGEDGPTHQPVEHLAALRADPHLLVFRPCDTIETMECWELALQARARPSVLALTRQNLPLLRKDAEARNRCATGAYELLAADDGKAQASLFASGSEIAIAVEAKRILATRGISSRVVSVPCIELLLELPEKERAAIVGTAPVKVAIEAAVRQGWDAVIGSDGLFVGMTDFGASAPYKELYSRFGITPDKVAEAAQSAWPSVEQSVEHSDTKVLPRAVYRS